MDSFFRSCRGRAWCCVAWLLCCLWTTAAHAEETPAPVKKPGLQKVAIGIYILSIGKFDISAGSYTVDFYLTLKADDPIVDPALEFSNGRAVMELLQVADGGREMTYRVLANLNTNIDLKEYPLDEQVLPIVLEHKTKTVSEWQFVINDKQTGIDDDVKFVGWDLKGLKPSINQHEYKVYNEVYSQYHLALRIARIRLPATMKTFLPILCFIIITFLSMLVTLEKIDNRLSMAIGTLIASVMFHVSLSNTIPPVGYLTMVDKVLAATYVVIGANLLITVTLMRRMQSGDRHSAQLWVDRGYVMLPLMSVVALAIAMLT